MTTPNAKLQRLRQMFAEAPGFMCFLHGTEHVVEVVNAATRQLVGDRDIVGMRTRDVVPELVAGELVALLDSVFATGTPYLASKVTVEHRLLDVNIQPIRSDDGSVVGLFVHGQDITVREQLDTDHRFMIASIPVQVWTAGADGGLDFVSDRVCAYFQTTAAAILGAGWQAVIHPDDLAACVALWTRSLETGEAYEVEFRLRRGDGEYRWHLGRANAQRDGQGTIIRWFGTNTDIHEAKVVLAELSERIAYERRLIGIVSHDLRTPLYAISLAAGLLADGDATPATQKTVVRLSRAADRATRLITDLLDFAKARLGSSIPINPRPTNLREIVEQVVDEFQMVNPERVVRVGHDGDEDGRWDADRIAQVLSNLVGNALQHGAPNVPIKVESKIDTAGAMFAVTNQGPVMSVGDLAQLFEPFKQGQTASAHAGRSMGLGLYIAREVVVAHGGTIEVESLPTGTCFTVRLPRFSPSPSPA